MSRKFGRKIENGKTLYINDTDMEKNYFSNYIVAVSLKENSEGNCTIEVTWRNDQPTYDIYLEKTNATTGEKVTASGDVTAKLNTLSTNGSLSMAENMGLMISMLGIILPLAVLIDLLLDKNRKLNPKDKKTDWFYQNEEFDRKLDDRADKNNYRTM